MTLRILWNSDRMVGGTSAYSRVTFEVCTRLARMGYQVAHVPMGRANRMGKWVYQGVLIYPSGQDPFNEDVILDHYVDWRADMLITCKEPWIFQQTHLWAYNFVPHAIIDHSPVSPSITSRLHTAFRIIVVSRFAQRELAQAGFTENVRYIPHGCDTQTFRPLENRAECKKLWFIKDPDDFTVLFIGRNQSRKMIPHVLKAYRLFRERNPDVKSHMLLWTDVNPVSREQYEGALGLGVADVGVNLLPEIMELGLGEAVLWPDAKLIREGLPDWAGPEGHDLVKLYNAADVVISLSGEGFWLPGLEAQSCGRPIVCANFAAAPEICGAGLTVDVQDYVVLNTPGTRYPICNLDRATEALTKIMNTDREKLAKKARTFAQRYDWNVIMERYWKPFLLECETELKPLLTKEGVKAWD
jgi:glycosyltransferase involved in cell wall biosynthesis